MIINETITIAVVVITVLALIAFDRWYGKRQAKERSIERKRQEYKDGWMDAFNDGLRFIKDKRTGPHGPWQMASVLSQKDINDGSSVRDEGIRDGYQAVVDAHFTPTGKFKGFKGYGAVPPYRCPF